ncbi:MAG: T9SS type A sorting domain-containing protein [Bacteroidetes bacterium]|nr:T9SS type A sorting domain-containing protein [Bacteroidota bacterium]
MKKFYSILLFACATFFANATQHTIFVYCTGINPTTTTAVCGDSIKWTWGGCSDSVRSTLIPACATPWYFPINTTTPVYTVVPCAGNYNFTCYCNTSYYSGIIVVSCSSPLTVTTSHTNVLCNGQCNGTATATASGGTAPYTYSWSPAGGTAPTAPGLCAGNYTVTVMDAVGATATSTVAITQPTPLAVTPSQVNVTCNGNCNGVAQVIVSGGTPGYTYSWAPTGTTTSTASGLCPGSYTCTIADANGCTITQTFIITQPTALSVNTSTVPASCSSCCDGSASAIATGGNPAYTYVWSPGGQTTATITNQCIGSYTCCVTDANGCMSCQVVTITFTTGVQDPSVKSNLNLFPSPATEFLTVKETFANSVSATITVSNILGETVFTKSVSAAVELNETINLAGYDPGVYFISVKTSSGTSTRRFVKE